MLARRLIPFLVIFSVAVSAFAGTEEGKTVSEPVATFDPFAKGATEFELLGGYWHSPITTGGAKRPQFDYAGGDLRLGIILGPILFDRSKIVRGNIEFLGDFFTDGVTYGPGNYLVGGSIAFRYNFIQPGSRIIPYLQLGGGGLHTDATEDPDQRIIGSDFEFLLESDLGARVLLNDRWSLILEGSYQHISNADTGSRNVGVNAIGGRLGLGFVF
jgi:hypothetical protein